MLSPLSLVRRRVVIQPESPGALRAALGSRSVYSYWGHPATLRTVNDWLGVDLTPRTDRPALACDAKTGRPVLDGLVFSECWVVSPDYEPGVRPAMGAIAPSEKIKGWQVLRMQWSESP